VKACPTCAATYSNDVAFCPHDGAALRSTAGLEPGSVIRKKYEIVSEIGRGGMGVVYRARHLIWNEDKALKVLVASDSGGQQGLKGLMAEALVMRQLQHPHIVRVEDADYTEDNQPFVVMEYIEGQSLRQRLQSAGALAPELALRFAAETCSALFAAHQKGIVHRDIKPQNLLLAKGADGAESVKVIDFGIAKVREDAGLGFTGIMTGTTGYFVCTPAYASPEQALGMRGSDLDGRSDLYSLGLVLYEMLTGRLPFAADNSQALLLHRLQVQPLPLDQARPGLTFSPDVSSLVMKALQRERENRFRSADEMRRAIWELLNSWRTERERQERERVRTTRLATVQGETEPLDREDGDRQKRNPARRQAEQRPAGGTTRVKGDGSRSRLLAYGFGSFVAVLAALGIFIAHDNVQKPVLNAPFSATQNSTQEPNRPPTSESKALVPPPAPDKTTGATAEVPAGILAVLKRWRESMLSGNVDIQTDCYAPIVEVFFRRTNVDRATLLDIKRSLMVAYPDVRTYELSDLALESVSDDRAAVTFRKKWDAWDASQLKHFAGEERQRLTFVRLEGDWKIVREEELQVYWVRKK